MQFEIDYRASMRFSNIRRCLQKTLLRFSNVRYSKFFIDENYFYHKSTIFRKIDDDNETSICITINEFDFKHHFKCFRDDFESTIVLTINHN